MGLEQTTAPAVTPITLDEAKEHLRIPKAITGDDAYLERHLIPSAWQYVEKETQRQLITATWQLTLDCFPPWTIKVPKPNLISVTTLTYINTAGTSTSLTENTDFIISTSSKPGRITPAYTKSWPTTRQVMDAVTLTYTAGFGAAANSIPEDIIHAMFLLLGHFYENREATIVGVTNKKIELAVTSLLAEYKFPVYA